MARLTNLSPARNGRAGAAEDVSWLVCGLPPSALADPFEPAGFEAHPATIIVVATAPARRSFRSGLARFVMTTTWQ
jgi:hypothetical protein